jgi:hypothetical protein
VGSVPIARSTLKATPGHAGLQDAEGVAVSWPHASSHCPEIHTYGHTQQFTK